MNGVQTCALPISEQKASKMVLKEMIASVAVHDWSQWWGTGRTSLGQSIGVSRTAGASISTLRSAQPETEQKTSKIVLKEMIASVAVHNWSQ